MKKQNYFKIGFILLLIGASFSESEGIALTLPAILIALSLIFLYKGIKTKPK